MLALALASFVVSATGGGALLLAIAWARGAAEPTSAEATEENRDAPLLPPTPALSAARADSGGPGAPALSEEQRAGAERAADPEAPALSAEQRAGAEPAADPEAPALAAAESAADPEAPALSAEQRAGAEPAADPEPDPEAPALSAEQRAGAEPAADPEPDGIGSAAPGAEPAADPDSPSTGSPEPATLSIVAVPWGRIWVDGRRVGDGRRTIRLPPGPHTVAVGVSRPGRAREIELEPGAHERVVLHAD